MQKKVAQATKVRAANLIMIGDIHYHGWENDGKKAYGKNTFADINTLNLASMGWPYKKMLLGACTPWVRGQYSAQLSGDDALGTNKPRGIVGLASIHSGWCTKIVDWITKQITCGSKILLLGDYPAGRLVQNAGERLNKF